MAQAISSSATCGCSYVYTDEDGLVRCRSCGFKRSDPELARLRKLEAWLAEVPNGWEWGADGWRAWWRRKP